MPLGDGEELGLKAGAQIYLKRCPHCFVANPALVKAAEFSIMAGRPDLMKGRAAGFHWMHYSCQTCGGVVSAALLRQQNGNLAGSHVAWIIPKPAALDSTLPERVSYYLAQAQETLTSPSASVVMSASAVDAMLKNQGYKDGSLFARIEKAAAEGIITKAMAAVAHDVRLDANNERHVDENAPPPSIEDARRCFEFADALAELIFVLPSRVKHPR